MPSSHAQFVAYFSAFLTLFVLLRHNPHHAHASSTHIPTPYWQRLALALLSMAGAAAVAQSRIYLSYHTPIQVYAGVLAGVICAVGWFVVTSAARHWGVVDMLLDTPLARYAPLTSCILQLYRRSRRAIRVRRRLRAMEIGPASETEKKACPICHRRRIVEQELR